MSKLRREKQQRAVDAWHEAGHAVHGLRVGFTLDYVSIAGGEITGSLYGGKKYRAVTNFRVPRCTLLDLVANSLAGPFVESAKFPDHHHHYTDETRLTISPVSMQHKNNK